MGTFERNDGPGGPWSKRVLERLRRMAARLRGEAADWDGRDLSADDLDRILAQVAPSCAADAPCAEAPVKRYVSYVSRHPAQREMQSAPDAPCQVPSPDTNVPPAAPAEPNAPASGGEIGQLESVRNSMLNTADALRKAAEQMRQNVESQKRVNEKLAELRERIRESTERMKRRHANLNLKKALDEQTDSARHEPDGIAPTGGGNAADSLLPSEVPAPPGGRIPYHERVELMGLEEYEKFARMGSITDDDIRRVREADWWVKD